MKPLILIVSRLIADPQDNVYGSFYRLNAAYADAITAAGGIALLGATADPSTLARMADGLLLPGGIDISPAIYGESRLNDTVQCDARLDALELALFRSFCQQGKPIFGICRGLQLINVAAGGTLWQDMKAQVDCIDSHKKDAVAGIHPVQVKRGSMIHQLFGDACLTNAHHHQAICRLAHGFQATAWTDDGMIEAIEHETDPIMAVQWHPERMLQILGQPLEQAVGRLTEMLPLFERYVSSCLRHRLQTGRT